MVLLRAGLSDAEKGVDTMWGQAAFALPELFVVVCELLRRFYLLKPAISFLVCPSATLSPLMDAQDVLRCAAALSRHHYGAPGGNQPAFTPLAYTLYSPYRWLEDARRSDRGSLFCAPSSPTLRS